MINCRYQNEKTNIVYRTIVFIQSVSALYEIVFFFFFDKATIFKILITQEMDLPEGWASAMCLSNV